ncbi:MAG: hypothetical protein K2L37_00875, partial [Lactobacillus sp.]|nr:hypothetical protein [Lactobacillus sp.]
MSNLNIQQLLQKQQEEVSKTLETSEMQQQVQISEYNNNRIIKLYDLFQASVSKSEFKGVWNEFVFGSVCGAVLGILRQAFMSFKDRQAICSSLGLAPVYVDLYLQYAGNAPYAKDGVVIEARPMNIEKTRELVKIVATKLQLIVTDNDLAMINEANEQSRN